MDAICCHIKEFGIFDFVSMKFIIVIVKLFPVLGQEIYTTVQVKRLNPGDRQVHTTSSRPLCPSMAFSVVRICCYVTL